MLAEGTVRCRQAFLVIGAPDTLAHALFATLEEHPEVAVTRPALRGYFASSLAGLGLTGFGTSFIGTRSSALGDHDPGYSSYPSHGDVPRRIRAALPDARIVYCVTDPIERLRRHLHREPSPGWTPRHLAPSLYGLQLDRYLRYFEPTSILVVPEHALLEHPGTAIATIEEFLGLQRTSPRRELTPVPDPPRNPDPPASFLEALAEDRQRFLAALEACVLATGDEPARWWVPDDLTRRSAHRLVR